jgi:hypothetical protein
MPKLVELNIKINSRLTAVRTAPAEWAWARIHKEMLRGQLPFAASAIQPVWNSVCGLPEEVHAPFIVHRPGTPSATDGNLPRK